MVLNIMDYWDYMTYYPEYVENTMGGIDFVTNEEGASYYFRTAIIIPMIYQEHRALPLLPIGLIC